MFAQSLLPNELGGIEFFRKERRGWEDWEGTE